jgi:hypothetical protein
MTAAVVRMSGRQRVDYGRSVGLLRRCGVGGEPGARAGEFRAGPTSSPSQQSRHRASLRRGRGVVRPRLGLAFPRGRLSLPFRARFGAESSARGRVDALVAIVPADAIPRRGVAAHHFLNDTAAGSAAR